jgi:hypothetical protein
MLAGVIVTVVGLAVAMMHTFDVPGYWTTLVVGIAMLVGGAIRAAIRGRREPTSGAA